MLVKQRSIEDDLRYFLSSAQLAPAALFKTTRKTPEQLLKQMPSIKYEVTKVITHGPFLQRKQRILLLEDKGMSNITDRGVTSYFSYENLLTIELTHNLNSFKFECSGAKHAYIYESPIGMQIVQEIRTRRSLRRLASNMLTTVPDSIFTLPPSTAEQNQTETRNVSPSYESKSSSSSEGLSIKDVLQSAAEKRASNIYQLIEDTEEQRQETHITMYLLSKISSEGKAVQHFIQNFNTLEKNIITLPINVRNFIDSLKEHILRERKEELLHLLPLKNDGSNDKSTSIDQKTTMNEIGHHPVKAALLPLKEVVERTIQKVILGKLNDKIRNSLENFYSRDDTSVDSSKDLLSLKTQHYLINEKLHSPSEWGEAVAVLDQVASEQLPWKKAEHILESFRVIFNLVSVEHKDAIVGADDLVPIYLFVLTQSHLKNLVSLSEYLYHLNDPELSGVGEKGYYMTVFFSTVEYLKNLGEEDLQDNL